MYVCMYVRLLTLSTNSLLSACRLLFRVSTEICHMYKLLYLTKVTHKQILSYRYISFYLLKSIFCKFFNVFIIIQGTIPIY